MNKNTIDLTREVRQDLKMVRHVFDFSLIKQTLVTYFICFCRYNSKPTFCRSPVWTVMLWTWNWRFYLSRYIFPLCILVNDSTPLILDKQLGHLFILFFRCVTWDTTTSVLSLAPAWTDLTSVFWWTTARKAVFR